MIRKPGSAPRRYGGFTLIELLVVMAIIGVLVALLLPAVQKIRESANNTKCKNNLRQIGLGLFHYQTNFRKFPDGSHCTKNDNCFQDWAISILPFIEQDNLYREFDFKQYQVAGLNENQTPAALAQLVKTFVCPTDPDAFQPVNPSGGPGSSKAYMPSNYKAVEGVIPSNPYLDKFWDRWDNAGDLMSLGYKNLRGVLHVTRPDLGLVAEAARDITDGLSNTIIVGEYTTTTGFSHGKAVDVAPQLRRVRDAGEGTRRQFEREPMQAGLEQPAPRRLQLRLLRRRCAAGESVRRYEGPGRAGDHGRRRGRRRLLTHLLLPTGTTRRGLTVCAGRTTAIQGDRA
jgi:prepilin-type N-terminal cleavage/methylation domain-containing protein